MSRTPILCYHNVEQAPDGSRFKLLYVSPEQFDRQLWTLRRLGMRGVHSCRSNCSGLTYSSLNRLPSGACSTL